MRNIWECDLFGPPDKPGVYCIMQYNYLNKDRQILYIGSSCSIYKRTKSPSHHYQKLLNSTKWPLLIAVKYKVTEDYRPLEDRLIKRLKPKLNIRNGA
jgi:excinuclease UvrABC nuclease subunit